MKENYTNLEFQSIKEAVAKNCSFSLGVQYILNENAHFNYLWAKRENTRGKEALKLYSAYRSFNFAGVYDITNSIMLIDKGGVVSPQELYQIASFSKAVLHIQKYMQASEIETPAIADLVDSLSTQKNIIAEIEKCISNAYEIMDSASVELKGIRKAITQCDQKIAQTTQSIITKYAGILMDSITATRNNRTCVLVKASDKHKIRGFIHGESASGQAVYVEPEILLQLNNQLQSLQAKEKEEEERILRALCTLIMPQTHAYLSDLDTMTILDALFAKAKWAYERCGVYASIEEKGTRLYFKDARHPLIDEEKVVANTYEIKPPYHHLLITGSNTGGKTVTLKTIGLFTVLTYAGFPVLCEEAIVPFFDGVYVDIGDAQSIVESLSTFSAHLSKLAHICEVASDHSLVLLDELGSGTDPNEGECLAIATLDYFREHNIMCIATTHYSKLKEYAKNKEDILLASVAFDIEKMQPTYRYLEGYSGVSNALEIALRYHLKADIIEKARLLKETNKSESQRLMEKLDEDFMRIHQKEESLQEMQEQLIKQKQQLIDEQKQFTLQKDKILSDAKEQAALMIEEASEKAKQVIRELKQLKGNVKEHEIIAIKAKLKQKEEDEVESEVVHQFKEKDYVKLKGLDYHGEIIAMKGNRATVLANGMKMNVKVSELALTHRPNIKKVVSHTSKRTSSSRVSSECNVIGMRVEEALSVIDKYLDSAMYAKMYQVRLVHGHGTGALRKGIHQYLKRNKHVDSYRLGGEGEGGLGATVVSLKHGDKNG
ncbi:MAG: endonuclease MutS2 [Erysipelotrichia bacterium]|nr:endonuclease MutS2 [Erysipelotrichia bacterium]NCC53965.1 endonuclease MutS2 [Erysipelotrichia bacterium]